MSIRGISCAVECSTHKDVYQYHHPVFMGGGGVLVLLVDTISFDDANSSDFIVVHDDL